MNSFDSHKLPNKSKLNQLLANALLGAEKPDAVVVTEDMIPQAIKKDIEKFTQLFFTSKEYGRFLIDRIDLEPAIVWYTVRHERVERRFSDLFSGRLASCPGCGGKLFRLGPYWRCKDCVWNNIPSLGYVPMSSLSSTSSLLNKV